MARFMAAHRRDLMKTGSYYLLHVSVAALVAYAVTGDAAAAFALSLLEPSVQAVVFFVHEKAWQRQAAGRGACV